MDKNGKNKKATDRPNLVVAHLPVTFNAGNGYVNAVFHVDNSTLGVRFESPEQMLEFFQQLMEKAAQVWPNNEWVQMWQSLDDVT